MITRACISINNRCDLACGYCHFHEKGSVIHAADMDVIGVLNNITSYIEKHGIPLFKLGFVGNGEPLLDFPKLKDYILHIDGYISRGSIAAYTITNGLSADREKLVFFMEHGVNVGFSLDGIPEIHNKWRCGSFSRVMGAVSLYKELNGNYPSMNCTVGRDILLHQEETIEFFRQFDNRITFSRMVGRYGISLEEYREFLRHACERLNVRTGGYDCTMYGGKCAAGMDNLFYANGNVYICGNCIDLPPLCSSDTPLDEIHFPVTDFDRRSCFKEGVVK